MIVIGTAGHIDHGKSSIVRRLTGSDPDRLPEERARGMTIDLGFAFYQTPTEETLAFVDVPGHERFVKNMIAGAGGIDSVMLVIAADDGWMPQSQEHFQVVRLLGVTDGMIVINKTDLVEPEWRELQKQGIAAKVKGSFLEGAPVFSVSAATGEGFDELRAYLDTLTRRLSSRKSIGKARLYIDRSFVQAGIGGVVTGTLRGGTLSVGQPVTVWPSQKHGRVRSLQSNNRAVQTAEPGQRTAVGFSGIDKDLLVRGGVISDRAHLGYFTENPVLTLAREMLPEASVEVGDRRRLLLIVGTTEVEGEVRLLTDQPLVPGRSGVVFFKPDEPVYTLINDHFIARLPTPMVTIGGGRVLDHLPHLPRRKDRGDFAYLELRRSGKLVDLLISELRRRLVVHQAQLLEAAEVSAGAVSSEVRRLVREGIVGLSGELVFEVAAAAAAATALRERVAAHLTENPHLKGLPFEQLAALCDHPADVASFLIDHLVSGGELVKVGEAYNLVGRGMSLKGPIKTAHDEIMAALRAEPYGPPTLATIAAKGRNHREAVRFVIESGEGHKCGADFVFLSEVWQEIIGFLRERLDSHEALQVGDLRDRFGFTRKFAIPILEETDRIGLTARDGDRRVKGEKYDDSSVA